MSMTAGGAKTLWLNRLYDSQRSCMRCVSDHGNLKFFSKAESTLQNGCDRRKFRLPASPWREILRNACSRIRVVNRIWIREELDSIRCVVNRGPQNTQVS